jgi:hypothetical protein
MYWGVPRARVGGGSLPDRRRETEVRDLRENARNAPQRVGGPGMRTGARRGQVAMNEPRAYVGERVEEREEGSPGRRRARDRRASTWRAPIAKTAPAFRDPVMMDANDSRMLDSRERPRLGAKRGHRTRIGRVLPRQELQRDRHAARHGTAAHTSHRAGRERPPERERPTGPRLPVRDRLRCPTSKGPNRDSSDA